MATEQEQTANPPRVIVVAPNKLLTRKCEPITRVTDDIRTLAHDMEEFLRNPPPMNVRPIGISAPQFGVCVRASSYILNPSAGKDVAPEIVTVINPALVYEKKIRTVVESCLSLPGRTFMVKRGKIVKMKAALLDGTPRVFRGHDLVAQLFLHELNHLDGILINSLQEDTNA